MTSRKPLQMNHPAYVAAKQYRDRIYAQQAEHAKAGAKYDKHRNAVGLLPDHIHNSAEYRKWKREGDDLHYKVRTINAGILKHFPAEYREDARLRREAKLPKDESSVSKHELVLEPATHSTKGAKTFYVNEDGRRVGTMDVFPNMVKVYTRQELPGLSKTSGVGGEPNYYKFRNKEAATKSLTRDEAAAKHVGKQPTDLMLAFWRNQKKQGKKPHPIWAIVSVKSEQPAGYIIGWGPSEAWAKRKIAYEKERGQKGVWKAEKIEPPDNLDEAADHDKLVTVKDGNSYEKHKLGHATAITTHREGKWELHSLRVPAAHRKQGHAHKMMHALTEHADRHGLTMKLLSSPLDKKTHPQKLYEFYRKHGFRETGVRVGGMPMMERKPQKVDESKTMDNAAKLWDVVDSRYRKPVFTGTYKQCQTHIHGEKFGAGFTPPTGIAKYLHIEKSRASHSSDEAARQPPSNLGKAIEVYTENLKLAVKNDKKAYAAYYGPDALSADAVGKKMIIAAAKGTANINSPAFKAAAKQLGIKNTVSDWKAYLTTDPTGEKKPAGDSKQYKDIYAIVRAVATAPNGKSFQPMDAPVTPRNLAVFVRILQRKWPRAEIKTGIQMGKRGLLIDKPQGLTLEALGRVFAAAAGKRNRSNGDTSASIGDIDEAARKPANMSKAAHYKGLSAWVRDYKECRKHGNVREAKRLRENIKKVIAAFHLDPDKVWGKDPEAGTHVGVHHVKFPRMHRDKAAEASMEDTGKRKQPPRKKHEKEWHEYTAAERRKLASEPHAKYGHAVKKGMFFTHKKDTFPYHVTDVDERGVHATEARPYWIVSSGTLPHKDVVEKIKNGDIRVLTSDKDVNQAKGFLDSKRRVVNPHDTRLSKDKASEGMNRERSRAARKRVEKKAEEPAPYHEARSREITDQKEAEKEIFKTLTLMGFVGKLHQPYAKQTTLQWKEKRAWVPSDSKWLDGILTSSKYNFERSPSPNTWYNRGLKLLVALGRNSKGTGPVENIRIQQF